MSRQSSADLKPRRLAVAGMVIFWSSISLVPLVYLGHPYLAAVLTGSATPSGESWMTVVVFSVMMFSIFLFGIYDLHSNLSTRIKSDALFQRHFWRKVNIPWREIVRVDKSGFVLVVKSRKKKIRIAPQLFHDPNKVLELILDNWRTAVRSKSTQHPDNYH